MKTFRHIVAAAIFALTLAGCAGLQQKIEQLQQVSTVTATITVNPAIVRTANDTFRGFEKSATIYLHTCNANPLATGCSDAAIAQLIPALRSGRAGRDELNTFYRRHPDGLGSQGAYDALKGAIVVISNTLTQYGIGGF